jgi:enamine deaminase RidA (YjgF/YER057c/UK114 family)
MTCLRLSPALFAMALFAMAALAPAQKRDVNIHNPPTLSKPNGYSHIAEVNSGKIVYIAGQIAADKDGKVIGKDDFAKQVQQVFENLSAATKAAGGSISDIIKLNYYIAEKVNPDQLPKLREIRGTFLNSATPPASTLLFVHALASPDYLIEIEAVAVIGK